MTLTPSEWLTSPIDSEFHRIILSRSGRDSRSLPLRLRESIIYAMHGPIVINSVTYYCSYLLYIKNQAHDDDDQWARFLHKVITELDDQIKPLAVIMI